MGYVEGAIVWEEVVPRVHQVLGSLPDPIREALILPYLCGFLETEAAAAVSVTG
jgi:DNA-directed RNA polymerase specialized sigma24 family protein